MEIDTVARDGAPSNRKRDRRARAPLATGDAPASTNGGVQPLMVTGTAQIALTPAVATATTYDPVPGASGLGGFVAETPDPDANKFVLDVIKFEAFGDRLLIQEDDFKSGYECDVCNGTGRSPLNPNIRCRSCEGKGGTIIVPDTAQRRPTTGIIVSTGELVKSLKVGQSVLYSSFAGHTIDLDRAGKKVVLRVLHEPEILCKVDGHLELKTTRNMSQLASFQN